MLPQQRSNQQCTASAKAKQQQQQQPLWSESCLVYRVAVSPVPLILHRFARSCCSQNRRGDKNKDLPINCLHSTHASALRQLMKCQPRRHQHENGAARARLLPLPLQVCFLLARSVFSFFDIALKRCLSVPKVPNLLAAAGTVAARSGDPRKDSDDSSGSERGRSGCPGFFLPLESHVSTRVLHEQPAQETQTGAENREQHRCVCFVASM